MKIPAINIGLQYVSLNREAQVKEASPVFKKNSREVRILEDKVSHILPLMKFGDVITVGKDISKVRDGLRKTLLQFNSAIKRIFHIDAPLAEPIAIAIDDESDFKCVNLGEKPIALVTSIENEEFPEKHIAIEPESSWLLSDGDTIVDGKNEFVIRDVLNEFANTKDAEFDFPLVTSFASAIYDFSQIQQPSIEKCNLAILKEFIKAEEAQTPKDKLSFKDVGGLDNVVDELKRSVVFPIKYPFAYENIALNRGILLYGPPGTGKTLLAEALAGECDAHYTKICGSDMESKWVGETEENWRNLFLDAKENQPSIIFIDEFDAVAKNRDNAAGDAHGPKVVNQILALMSDLEKSGDQIFVIAATNKPQLFDSAVVRSGRFGKQIEVTPPNRNGMGAIWAIHTSGKILDKKLNVEKLLDEFYAKKMTGADIKHIVNEAHLNSWVRNSVFEKMENGSLKKNDMKRVAINQEDFSKALKQWNHQQNKNERKPIGFGK